MVLKALGTLAGVLKWFTKNIVTGHFNGASKVFGGAGTGKTVVALHRLRHLWKPKNWYLKERRIANLFESIGE